MIQLQIIGNLGGDARVSDVNGKKAISFGVAHSEKFTDSKGEKVEKTTWVNCTLWRDEKKSNKVIDFLKKGIKVHVQGIPTVRIYDSQKTRSKQASLELYVEKLDLLTFPDKEDQGAGEAEEYKPEHVMQPAAVDEPPF